MEKNSENSPRIERSAYSSAAMDKRFFDSAIALLSVVELRTVRQDNSEIATVKYEEIAPLINGIKDDQEIFNDQKISNDQKIFAFFDAIDQTRNSSNEKTPAHAVLIKFWYEQLRRSRKRMCNKTGRLVTFVEEQALKNWGLAYDQLTDDDQKNLLELSQMQDGKVERFKMLSFVAKLIRALQSQEKL